jgi:hypothetical protein
MRNRLLVPVAMLFLAVGSAGAQMPSITLFGGAAVPTGDAGDGLNTGFTLGGALDLHVPATPFGARLEGTYARFGVKGLDGTGITAHASDAGANLNVVMTLVNAVVFKPYITAGPSYSSLKFTASDGTNSGSDSEGHWGYNAGAGIDFGLGPLGARVDVRYKHISANGGSWTSVPLTFGIRF